MLFSFSVLVVFAEYSVSAEYFAEFTAETFVRNPIRSDTSRRHFNVRST
jgi:hypothetical protein